MGPTLADLEILARQAGAILRVGYRQGRQIQYKSEIDLVTDSDHRSEEFLMREIRQRYPDQRIVTEESGEHEGQARGEWYLDPIDGTVNFAHGVPIFCVSIAYAEEGEVKLGVVYDPMQDECFSAERGGGAWLNGQAIHVSETKDLNHSLLATGFRYDIRSNPDNNLWEFGRLTMASQGVRRLGSAALDLCYVAAGRLDGYWELTIQPYDVAAGGLIAQEAGAIVTDLGGGVDYLKQPCTILAGTPPVHGEMLEIIKLKA